MAKSIFSGIGNAKPKFDANYDGPGHYLQRIDKIKKGENRKGIEFVAIEKTILHVFSNAEGHPDSHRIGDSVTFMVMADSDYFHSELSAFCLHILDEDLTEKSDDENIAVLEQLIADAQPLAGTVVETKARMVKTKADKDVTRVSFIREVPPSELAELLTEEEITRFFSGGRLEKMIAAESRP